MLLNLICWIYTFFISLGMGSLSFQILKLKPIKLSYLLLIGLFLQTLLVHFYAVLFPIDGIFYGINSLISMGLIFIYRNNIQSLIRSTFQNFKSWKTSLKLLLFVIFILSLMQSSVAPLLPDNESYYVQSIKWLNEYGLVKGLANLHIFFGQMSGLHLLQSSFNFGFITNLLNSINGFILLIAAFYSLNSLNEYFKKKKIIDLIVGLTFIAAPFLFRFLEAPSPDLPVYMVFPIIVSIFYKNYEKPRKEGILLIFVFSLWLILIKATVFPILIFGFILTFKSKLSKQTMLSIFSLCGIAFIAFCIKNFIVSGYPLYPTNIGGSILNADWRIPLEIQKMYYSLTQLHAYHITDIEIYQNWNFRDKAIHWFTLPKLHGLFNRLMILSLIISPFFTLRNKALKWIYIIGLIQFSALMITSPQYRFFFHILLIFSLIILAKILINRNSRWIFNFLLISIGLSFIPLFISFGIDNFTDNPLMTRDNNLFESSNFIYPKKNVQFQYEYKTHKEGNLIYQSPQNTSFWLTGDGNIPVLNEQLLNYLKTHYKIRPQLRTEQLKDGFYAEKFEE